MTSMVLTARFCKRKTHPRARSSLSAPATRRSSRPAAAPCAATSIFVPSPSRRCSARSRPRTLIRNSFPSRRRSLSQAGADARKFAVSGGVAQAVVTIKSIDPTREAKVATATGLHECRKLLMMPRDGKYDGYLLEAWPVPAAVSPAPVSSSRSTAQHEPALLLPTAQSTHAPTIRS